MCCRLYSTDSTIACHKARQLEAVSACMLAVNALVPV